MNFNIKTFLAVGFGLVIALGFIFLVFKFFPIGIAISVVGGVLATHALNRQDRFLYYLGTVGGLIYFGGIIISFIYSGLLSGIGAMIFGFLAYHYAKK